ncbi:uncharacterized protein LOC110036176 [Phalaenopsis equestris]|uniref:uncharacterized protein LOC110036176 n=1 Tax=Phalaenopsis equestris TaxID=78828 RepID=UPI0009E331C3|nr:uncharacterized protein LOC110036176 [Phalaenopsis equestris]
MGLASIVPILKKNGQIHACVEFRDLNKACPKDGFLLSIPELMVNIASTHKIFLFMDGPSVYNQIKLALEDAALTTFRTPIGIFFYTVMSFVLKNAEETYQQAMTMIVDDLIHNQVECYVEDLGDNTHEDTLAKLAKELACPLEDSLDTTVQECQVLSEIGLNNLQMFRKEEEMTITVADINKD